MVKKKHKIMTVTDLYNFCVKNNFCHFSSLDNNEEIYVQLPATFESEEKIDKDKEGLIPFVAKAYHDHINLNKSEIKPEVLESTLPSAMLRPILASIVVDEHTGEKDFGSHDFTIEVDEEGNENVKYIEQPVGVIFGENTIEYDEKDEVNRAILHGYLFDGYCQDAIDIMNRRKSVACSVELSVREMSFNASDKVLSLDDFYVSGLTLLGNSVKPGMKGSKLSIEDFNENNSIIKYSETVNEKLIETLDKLNCTIESLSKFNINSTEKVGLSKNEEGGDEKEMTKFEELLKKYNKTEADITFEVEGLSDEELEAKFAELFEEDTTDTSTEGIDDNTDEPKDGTVEGEEGTDTNADTNTDESGKDANEDEPTEEPKEDETATDGENFDNKEEKIVPKFSVTTLDGTVKEFELSLDDITNALYSLINNTYSEADNTWYSVTVYDNGSLIMHDWYNNRAYKQSYKQDGDNFSLSGDRVEVYSVWVTKEEQEALNEMKANYSSIQTELNTYKEAQLDAEKELIFSDEAYADFIETDEFKAIKDEMKVLSTDELRTKCDLAFAKLVKTAKTFSMKEKDEDNKKKPNKIGVMSTFENNADNEPYGDYFRSLEKI